MAQDGLAYGQVLVAARLAEQIAGSLGTRTLEVTSITVRATGAAVTSTGLGLTLGLVHDQNSNGAFDNSQLPAELFRTHTGQLMARVPSGAVTGSVGAFQGQQAGTGSTVTFTVLP
jgi:hypothetical protein